MDEDFDFTVEHPKMDMSKIDRIIVNGKEYLAADMILEIIKARKQSLVYDNRDNYRLACDDIELSVLALKGGE